MYLRARYYDPSNGRFNRLDPFAGNANDPQSLHKYVYAHNDPVQGIDPTGQLNVSATLTNISINVYVAGSYVVGSFPGAFGALRTVITVAGFAGLVASDDARHAFLATGDPSLAFASLADDGVYMLYSGANLFRNTTSQVARLAALRGANPMLSSSAQRIKNQFPDAIVGIRGSLVTGKRFSTGGPFNPGDFDVDAFIVSDELAASIPKVGNFRDGRNITEIGQEAMQIEEGLRGLFNGYRVEPNKPFTFRVWSHDEYERVVRSGPHSVL